MKGFTLIELLLVMGILVTLAATLTPFTGSLIQSVNRQTSLDTLVGLITQARTNSLNHHLSQVWGVCLQDNQLWLYSDTCLLTNQRAVYIFPGDTRVENFTDLRFDTRGELTTSANFTISSGTEVVDVSVNQLGAIDVN